MKFLEKLINETKDLHNISGTHRHSSSDFIEGPRWDDDDFAKAKVLKFIIDSVSLNDTGEDGSLSIDIDPIEFANYGNCTGDYCASPRFTIRKIDDTKFIIDIFDVSEVYDDSDEFETYYSDKEEFLNSFEYVFSEEELEEIKNSSLYILNTSLANLSNEEMVSLLNIFMDEQCCTKFVARDAVVRRYTCTDTDINRLTWVMYNLL